MGLPSTCSRILQSHAGAVNALALDKSGEYCMSGGSDKLVKLWNPLKGYAKPIQAYSGHSWDIVDLVIAPDSKTFASVGGDRACFYWDVSTGRIIRRFQGHTQRLTAVSMNEQGNVIASGSVDKSVRLWDCRTSNRLPIQILEDAKDTIGDIAIHSAEIIVGSIDGYVRIYDLRNQRLFQDKLGEPVTCVQASKDGLCYLAGCLDETVRLVDRADGSILNTFKGHKNREYSAACTFSNSDAHVWAGSEDGMIYGWDFVSGKVVKTLSGHTGAVSDLLYLPTSDILISSSFDGTIRVWT